MNGHFMIACLLGIVYQCSTKEIPAEIFQDFSGEGSGEVEDAVTVRLSSTTTVKMLNENNDIDDVIFTTSHTYDEKLINETKSVNDKEHGIHVGVTPADFDEVSSNQEAIIVLIVVASVAFCSVVVLMIVILLRKRNTSTQMKIPSVYRKI